MCISKSSKFFTLAFFLLLTNALFQACSDEFNLFNEELRVDGGWEEITLVYANFNVSNKIHLIRVNRGFAVSNFFDVNSIQDSIQYAPDELEVYFYKIYKDDTVKTYRCYDTVVQKDEGEYFNTGENIVYAFRETNMLGYAIDDLEYGVEVRTPKNNVVVAKTNPIGNFRFVIPNPYMTSCGFSANQFKVKFYVPKYSQIYEVFARVEYREISLFDTTPYSFTVNVGSYLFSEPSIGTGITGYVETLTLETPSNSFYSKLESTIKKYGDTVNTNYRKFTNITIEAISGNSDLVRAVYPASTTTGFSEDVVTYSNIINGLGSVSAYNKSVAVFSVDRATVNAVTTRLPQFKFQR